MWYAKHVINNLGGVSRHTMTVYIGCRFAFYTTQLCRDERARVVSNGGFSGGLYVCLSESKCNLLQLAHSVPSVIAIVLYIWLCYVYYNRVIHWGRVTHICVGKQTIIDLDNGLSPGQRHAIICTKARILLIWPLETHVSDILSEIHTFTTKCIGYAPMLNLLHQNRLCAVLNLL